jgi:hypothetical protein
LARVSIGPTAENVKSFPVLRIGSSERQFAVFRKFLFLYEFAADCGKTQQPRHLQEILMTRLNRSRQVIPQVSRLKLRYPA